MGETHSYGREICFDSHQIQGVITAYMKKAKA